MMRVIGWLGLAVLFTLTLMANRVATLEEVVFEGESRELTPGLVAPLLEKYQGQPLVDIDLPVIEQTLLTHPWIEKVALKKIWPDRILVRFEEPVPLMRWGPNELVTASGYKFTAGENILPRYAHLPSIELDSDPWEAGYERFMLLNQRIQTLDQKLMSLHQNAQLGWILKTEKGLTIYFGDKDFEQRLGRWVEAWGQLSPELKATAKRVDLRYSNGLAIAQ